MNKTTARTVRGANAGGVVGVSLFLLAGCGGAPAEDDAAIARQVADALIAACPIAAPSDERARALCARALAENKYLPSVMREPFLWGAQKPGAGYRLEDSNMNRFNIYVWRRLYLSLMMFTGNVTVERTPDGLTVVHLAVQFRNELATGSYPYPFWHSQKKWESYQLSRELLLVIENGRWKGAMRTADLDTSRPQVAHIWSGQWRWEDGGEQMPYVSLYRYLLQPENPHAARLDSAYRELSDGLRGQSCFMCHSPDNHANQVQLEMMNYPNQALFSRNSIIRDLKANVMPPANNDLGLPAGIADNEVRHQLISLAQEFKAAGDAALGYEGELKP